MLSTHQFTGQQSHGGDQGGRVEFLPVHWHDTLHSDDTGVDWLVCMCVYPCVSICCIFVSILVCPFVCMSLCVCLCLSLRVRLCAGPCLTDSMFMYMIPYTPH